MVRLKLKIFLKYFRQNILDIPLIKFTAQILLDIEEMHVYSFTAQILKFDQILSIAY